jgi:hypothetical protein
VPPDSPAVPRPILRRWAVPLIGVTLLAVIGLLVLEVVLLKKAGRRSGEDVAKSEKEDRTDKPATPPRKDTTAKGPDEVAIRPAVAHFDPPPFTPKPPPMPPSDPKKVGRPSEPVLTLVGGLTSAHLYQSYLNVGLLADSVAKGVYKPEEGKELLDTVGKVIDTVERQLALLPEDELQPEEKKRLDKVRSVLSLLRSEMKELKSYWDTGEEEYVTKFQKIHKSVWTELEKMLNAE